MRLLIALSLDFCYGPCSMDVSPSKSDGNSVSMDETMSTRDSFNSPDIEYVDNNNVPTIDSINRRTFSNLYISDNAETTGIGCKREVLAELEDNKVVDLDNSFMDPQLCATFACDIYKHLCASEVKKRPATDFMEKTQKDINPGINSYYQYVINENMKRYVHHRWKDFVTLLTTHILKTRFCKWNPMMNYLKFEMTVLTTKCFLRRFVHAAQGANEVTSMQLECLANYIAKLSLLEYNMLCYAPSLIAASAIFLPTTYFFLRRDRGNRMPP